MFCLGNALCAAIDFNTCSLEVHRRSRVKRILGDEEFFPPFAGFPKEGIEFLKRLKKNNNRPWFRKHKSEYEENVRFSMQCLIATLAQKMIDEAPEMEFNPRKSIFRIYRDVRFSRNKAPYKTNVAASFGFRGKKSPTETPGLYVGIEPGEIFIGGGLYMPTGDQLKAIRQSIVNRPEEFLAVVEHKLFKKEFGGIEGECLKKAPLGYDQDHPMITHLRHKQFYVGKVYGDEICLKPKFVDLVAHVLAGAMPLVRWLIRATS
jgi:uncharacterized protein (TIGR02453 family)